MGSSNRMTSGFSASVRAMDTRCCWPPESWRTLLSRCSGKPQLLQHALRDLTTTRLQLGLELQRILHVSTHGHVLEQRVVLEDDAHAAVVRRRRGDVAPAERERTLVGHQEADEDAQRGGLTAPRRAKDGEELAVQHVEVQRVQHFLTVEALHEAARGQLLRRAAAGRRLRFVRHQYFHLPSSLFFSSGSVMPVMSA